MAKKSALGTSLNALLGDIDDLYANEFSRTKSSKINIDKISLNPHQPRKEFNKESLDELASSIKEYGLIQPIVLCKKDENEYVLVAGERRLRACKSLGYDMIKAVVDDEYEKNLAELALIENIQREDLNPLELATAYKQLMDKKELNQEKLAKLLHISRSEVANVLRILKLSDESKSSILKGELSKAHAKILAGLNKDQENKLRKEIIDKKLNVQDAQKKAFLLKSNKNDVIENELKDIVDLLQDLGFKAQIKSKKIVLEFKKPEQIEDFKNRLKLGFK